MKILKNAPDTKNILDFFLDTKWDTEQYQILSQIPKSFANTKSSISDTKMATLQYAMHRLLSYAIDVRLELARLFTPVWLDGCGEIMPNFFWNSRQFKFDLIRLGYSFKKGYYLSF